MSKKIEIPEALIGAVARRIYAGVSGMTARAIAREAILDVLTAVRDGRQELLDQVGRVDTNEQGIIEWFEGLREELGFGHGSYPILIAFRPGTELGE